MRRTERHDAKDGSTTWRVRFREGVSEKTGKPRQTCVTFDHQHQANQFAALIDNGLTPTAALRQMRVDHASRTGPTLDQLAEQFFAWKETDVRSDRTVADYRRDYRNWIKPTLGDRPAAAVTDHDVQSLIDEMTRTKLKPKSIADRHAILHGIYKWGIERGHVDRSPCLKTRLPKRVTSPPKGLRPNEWAALHAALRSIDTDAADLAEFMLATGWRWSEATALDVFDVEDNGVTVYVTMGRVMRRNAHNEVELVEDAKSESGHRRTRLDDDAAEVVRRRVGSRYAGLVFTTKTGAKWHYSHFRERAWNPAVKAAKLTRNPTPHWLRHSQAFWMLLAGAPVTAVQRRLGHKHISTTNDVYARMIEDVDDAALERFAAMRAGATRPAPLERSAEPAE